MTEEGYEELTEEDIFESTPFLDTVFKKVVLNNVPLDDLSVVEREPDVGMIRSLWFVGLLQPLLAVDTGGGRLKVVDGNRRVACLKALKNNYGRQDFDRVLVKVIDEKKWEKHQRVINGG